MAYDGATVNTAYITAKNMGASSKVMLALFEAAIVESGFRNLNYGDRDSVGYLQQRPSQGWPNPMDVPTATRSFVNKAMPIQNNYATAGMLAQGVQISAFPLKYDAVMPQAQALLNQVSKGSYVPSSPPNSGSTPVSNPVVDWTSFWNNLGSLVSGVNSMVGGVSKIVTGAGKGIGVLTNVNTYIRIAYIIAGFVLMMMALSRLASPVAKPVIESAAKTAKTAAKVGAVVVK